jgi:Tfp pilus assembly protein PilO
MKISARDKRYLIAGSIAVCIFVVCKFLMFPFYDRVAGQRREIEAKEKNLEKYLAFMKKQSELQQTLQRLTGEETDIKTNLLGGETTSLAAADIQKIVDAIAAQSQVQVKSVKVMDPYEKGTLMAIPVQVIFDSDPGKLSAFIKSIETDRKLLTIQDLKIRVKDKRKPGDISVTLKIVGFMQKKENKA